MNCKNARHLIFAFADGQLDVRDNCDLLDHLKMCPACTARVDEHQRLRVALRRSIENIEVPAALAAKVRANVLGAKAPRDSRRLLRLVPVFLATAACIAFAFHSISDFVAGGLPITAESNRVVPRGLNAAVQVTHKHLACTAGSHIHDNMESTVNPTTLGRTMTARYANSLIVMVPDFTNQGYHLETAAYCGVQDTENRQGAHLVFASNVGNDRLSFFSVPRWDCLDQCGHRDVDGTGLKYYNVPQESGGMLNLVYWHQDSTTYIVCGTLSSERLSSMVRGVHDAGMAAAGAYSGNSPTP